MRALGKLLGNPPKGKEFSSAIRIGTVLSRSQVAADIKTCVRASGLDPKEFDTHSFRAGEPRFWSRQVTPTQL